MQQSQQQLEYALQEVNIKYDELIKKVKTYLSVKDNYIKEKTQQNIIILSKTENELKAIITKQKEDSSLIQFLNK